jgi:hypothetical protein
MAEPIGVQVVFDAASPAALADFWAFALGYRLQDPPPGYDDWQQLLAASGVPEERWDDANAIVPMEGNAGPRVFFQKVPESKERKNRLHLDVKVGRGIEDEEQRWSLVLAHVDALQVRGANVVDERTGQWGEHWIVMTDPEGNEFCVT